MIHYLSPQRQTCLGMCGRDLLNMQARNGFFYMNIPITVVVMLLCVQQPLASTIWIEFSAVPDVVSGTHYPSGALSQCSQTVSQCRQCSWPVSQCSMFHTHSLSTCHLWLFKFHHAVVVLHWVVCAQCVHIHQICVGHCLLVSK